MNDSRYVECEIEISVNPDKVIVAFTAPEQLKAWWGVDRALIEPRKDGIYILNWGVSQDGIKYVSSGVIDSIDLRHHIQISKWMYFSFDRPILGPMQLIVEAISIKSGSLVKLKQGPYLTDGGANWDWYYAAVTEAWPNVLLTLKSYLEEW
jgi:Activator of Hsp90 ATPase homolog 1-like protein